MGDCTPVKVLCNSLGEIKGVPLGGADSSQRSGCGSEGVEPLVLASRQKGGRGLAEACFRELFDVVARDVPLIRLWQCKEYVLSSEDVGGGP
jgi:peptide/nickel transport system substrate-binding protein